MNKRLFAGLYSDVAKNVSTESGFSRSAPFFNKTFKR